MNNTPEYKVGIVNERPIRFYRYDEETIKKTSIKCPYFLNRFEVARLINRKTETIDSFINARNNKSRITRYDREYRQRSKSNDFVGALTTSASIKATSFEEAALYWFEFAILGNSLAMQISTSIIEKPLEKIAAEIYWKKAIADKQLHIQEAVKIAKQEETIVSKSILVNKQGDKLYTLSGTIEKAMTIMRVGSTADALNIIESGTKIKYTKNPVVRLGSKVITKEIHDEIIDVANRYRFIDSKEIANAV